MRFRVTFMERTNAGGVPSEKPRDYVEIDLPEGVVLDKTFVERTEPKATHVEDSLEEDDDFLSVGSESWDLAIECVALDDEPTEA